MSALVDAIEHARKATGTRTAKVMVLAPARANAVLLRQRLMLEGPWINVRFGDPDSLLRELAQPHLLGRALRTEPTGWTELALSRILRTTESPWSETLQQPGWIRPLSTALQTLTDVDLRTTTVPHPPLNLLRTLQQRLDEERIAAGFATFQQTAQAAAIGLANPALPANRPKAVVLFGDKDLHITVHQTLKSWLKPRSVVRLLTSATANLKPAPLGLRSAAPNSPTFTLRNAPESQLASLQSAIYRSTQSTPADASLRFARTPDDVRECDEVVREALHHVDAGVALSDIAIAVPDAQHIATLQHALLRAKLPATFLVGPPLSTSPAAAFLTAALDLAEGPRTALAWHRFLSLPGIRLRAVLGAPGTTKRGRWRKLLRHCGMHRDAALIDALAAWSPAETAHDAEGDLAAQASLTHTLSSLSAELNGLVKPTTWSQLAAAWSQFLTRWWSGSADRGAVLNLLTPAGDAKQISIASARSHLARLLEQTPQLSCTLSDRAIRVAAPMNLLGGQFRVVLAMGLSDGRFPTRAQEDPFLPDSVIQVINRELSIELPTSRAHADRERRRFAALVASCSETLWLSSPAMDMGQDRPLLPSPFLLDALRAIGAPPTYAALEQAQVIAGSRSDVLPAPSRAIDPSEHRAARILKDPIHNAPWMCAHVLHRAQLSHLLHHSDPEPNVWNGLVTSPLPAIPGWEDDGARVFILQYLLTDPQRYLLRYVFGAYPAKPFPRPPDPFDRNTRQRALLDRFDLDHSIEETVAAYDAEVAERFGGTWPPGMRSLALAIARKDAESIHRIIPDVRPAPSLEGVSLAPDLPWRVGGQLGFVADDTFFSLDQYAPKTNILDRPATAMHAMAVGASEWQPLVPFKRSPKPKDVAAFQDEILDRLRAATTAIRTGWWPKEVGE